MPKVYEGGYLASGKKFAIVVSRFNDFITEKLVGGAVTLFGVAVVQLRRPPPKVIG